jgi:hypothetical protein
VRSGHLGSLHPAPIDISTINTRDLVRIVEEVEATKTPRELQKDNKIVAVLMPVEIQQKRKTSIEETLALAGAWGERNWNEVEEELDRIRHQSKPTPPFTFDE